MPAGNFSAGTMFYATDDSHVAQTATASSADLTLGWHQVVGLRAKGYATGSLPVPTGTGAVAFDLTTNHLKIYK